MIRSYLRDIINNLKTQGKWKVHSGNEVINYKTQGQWKTQLTMINNIISSKDTDEIRTMYMKSNNIEIMMSNETDEVVRSYSALLWFLLSQSGKLNIFGKMCITNKLWPRFLFDCKM